MDKKTFINTVFEKLNPPLKKRGFKGNKKNLEFVRKDNEGFNNISVSVVNYGEKYQVRFYLSIRKNVVEDIWNKTSGLPEKYQSGSFTIIADQGNLLNLEGFEYVCFETPQIQEAVDDFIAFLDDKGNHFFQKYVSIEVIENEMNKNPKEVFRFMTSKEDRAMRGIILASLLGKGYYNELVEKYRDSISGLIKPLKQKFENTVKYLEENEIEPN